MEALSQQHRILRHLALIYLALAHGTDQDLNDAELNVMARRLQDLQAGISEGTVLGAIKDALADYTRPDNADRIKAAIHFVAEWVPPSMQRRVLDDLSELARADGKVLYAEAQFLGRLEKAWHLTATNTTGTWSIFRSSSADETWTPVHDLALVYITLAHQTDQQLSDQELRMIKRRMSEWVPDADVTTLDTMLRTALDAYGRQTGGHTFANAVSTLRAVVPTHQQEAVLKDLRYIANADGVMLVEERVMIEALAEAWSMQ